MDKILRMEVTMLHTNEINIRDPYVLTYQGKYYLYGTRGATCWGEADGFDCYVSIDMENWEGPIEVFHKPADFWADKNYWAPEVHEYEGNFYMFATFNSVAKDMKGTLILKADNPLGTFRLHSKGKITPDDWNCLDGTFYVDKSNNPYMIFCHEWVDTLDGEIYAVPLSKDLSEPAGEPFLLFKASEAAAWVRPIEHHRYPDDKIYVTDGPFIHRCSNGELLILWSSFGEHGYVEAIARSDNRDVTGKWTQDDDLLFSQDGGHGMLFTTNEGKLMLTLHSPNTHLMERPVFYEIEEKDGKLYRLS